jgi:hypothetical protein
MSFRQSHHHEPQPKTFCATVFCGADTPTLGCPGQLKLDMLPGHPLRDSNHVRRRRRSARIKAPSPGLEPELSEPKSDVLPITPRRIGTTSG